MKGDEDKVFDVVSLWRILTTAVICHKLTGVYFPQYLWFRL